VLINERLFFCVNYDSIVNVCDYSLTDVHYNTRFIYTCIRCICRNSFYYINSIHAIIMVLIK